MTLRPIDAEFIGSFPREEEVPKISEPQLLFIGRSNVGKSSLINRIAGRKNLARTSGKPGKTQAINLFRITLQDDDGQKSKIVLADLPGFGFAKVSKRSRSYFENLIVGYIDRAENVASLLLLQDSRRNPGEEEVLIRDIAFENGHIVYVVLTKVDKLKKNDVKKSQAKIAQKYSLESEDILLSGENIPVSNIFNRLQPLLDV